MALRKSDSDKNLTRLDAGKSRQSVDAGKAKKAVYNAEKVDYSQPVIVKNSKITFGEKLQMAKEQHQDVLEDLVLEMEDVKRENNRLRRQQEDTYGISLDTVDRMRHELERARTTRMFLLEDIENRKQRCEKMETDMFELNMKLESFTKKINEYKKMQNEWETTSEKLTKTEERCERLSKINKNMRMLLIKHHIDPKSVDFDSGKSRKSDRSTKSLTLKPILKSGEKRPGNEKKNANGKSKKDTSRETHSYTHVGDTVKKMSRSMDDISSIQNSEGVDELKKKMAMTNRQAMGRGPPAYLGYYTDIHHNRMQIQNKHKALANSGPVHFPRIAAVS